jgi:hypothetical protein
VCRLCGTKKRLQSSFAVTLFSATRRVLAATPYFPGTRRKKTQPLRAATKHDLLAPLLGSYACAKESEAPCICACQATPQCSCPQEWDIVSSFCPFWDSVSFVSLSHRFWDIDSTNETLSQPMRQCLNLWDNVSTYETMSQSMRHCLKNETLSQTFPFVQ